MKNSFFLVMSVVIIGFFSCNKKEHKTTDNNAPIPVIGHTYNVDYGEYAFRLDFKSETEMTYTSLKGSSTGDSETVKITRREIRPNVFWVYWQEADSTTVSHLQDFEKKVIYSNITWPDKSFTNLQGVLTFVK